MTLLIKKINTEIKSIVVYDSTDDAKSDMNKYLKEFKKEDITESDNYAKILMPEQRIEFVICPDEPKSFYFTDDDKQISDCTYDDTMEFIYRLVEYKRRTDNAASYIYDTLSDNDLPGNMTVTDFCRQYKNHIASEFIRNYEPNRDERNLFEYIIERIVDDIISKEKQRSINIMEKTHTYLLDLTFYAGSDDKEDTDRCIYIIHSEKPLSEDILKHDIGTANKFLGTFAPGNKLSTSYENGLNIDTLMDGYAEYSHNTVENMSEKYGNASNPVTPVGIERYFRIEQWQ